MNLIPAKTVLARCGGISDMSLWRWLQDAEIAFPRPIVISKRRYWNEAELTEWLDAQAAKRAVAA